MGELRKLEFFQGVLGTGGEFICDEGWVKQAIHMPTGKSLADLRVPGYDVDVPELDRRLLPGVRLILQGRVNEDKVEVRHVYVQEELR